MFTPGGQLLLDALPLEGVWRYRVDSCRDLLDAIDDELEVLEAQPKGRLAADRGYRAIQAINGIGPISAAILVAEIGDVSRFPDARHLCSWAGLTPTHRESDTKVHRGHITKQGSTLVRWICGAPGMNVGHPPGSAARSCGNTCSIGPTVSMTSASAALAEWKP